jgi:hypothetical protein
VRNRSNYRGKWLIFSTAKPLENDFVALRFPNYNELINHRSLRILNYVAKQQATRGSRAAWIFRSGVKRHSGEDPTKFVADDWPSNVGGEGEAETVRIVIVTKLLLETFVFIPRGGQHKREERVKLTGVGFNILPAKLHEQ